MTTPRARAFAIVFLFTASCAHHQHDENAPGQENGPLIKKLTIEGAQKVKPKDIEKKILSAQDSWIPFSKKHHFDEGIWRTDLRRIERYYHELGYYQAQIVEDEVLPDGQNAVKLRVKVDEGQATTVDSVALAGIEDLPEDQRNQLWGHVPLKKGDIFVEDKWESTKPAIESALHEMGYATAKVEGEAEVDLVERKAKLPITITLGPRYKFGDVSVKAQPEARVEQWRIIEKAKQSVKPGNTYSEGRKDEAQQKIFGMGVFGAAQVKNGDPDVANGVMPIVVDVRESPFHSLRVGGGGEFDQARNEARAIGEYINRDFMGGLRKLDLKATAGYAFIPSAYSALSGSYGLAKQGPVATLSAELTQPRLFHPDLSLQTRVEIERQLEPAYTYYGGRAKLGVVWQPRPWLSILPSYNIEAYNLSEGNVDLGGVAPQLLFGCPEHCVLSYLEERIDYDRRDDKQEPHHGVFLSLGIQEGGGPLGGSFSYIRLMPDARYYVTPKFDPDLTLSARVRIGELQPASGNPTDSPIVARFFSGGANSMRGFNSRDLSPRLVVGNPPGFKSDYGGEALPVGGNGLIEASFEARHKVVGQLLGAAFLDTGTVTESAFTPDRIGAELQYLQLAVGGGIRYLTPVGPIRLDLAYRPNVGKPLQVSQVPGQNLTYPSPTGCFGIGGKQGTRAGSPEGPCTIQFSIGEAF